MAGALLLGLAGFAAVAIDQALDGPLERADGEVTGMVGAWQQAGFPTRILGALFTAIGAWPTVYGAVAVAAGWMWLRRQVRLALWCVGVALSSSLAVEGLKLLFRRARPSLLDPLVHGYSFPSGHTLGATAALGAAIVLATEAWLRRHPQRRGVELRTWRRAILAWAALSLLTGLGRVLLREHWLSDVVASWSLGTALVAGVLLALSRAHPAGEGGPLVPEPEGPARDAEA
jgi:membrane-associated phospholipid phosphatase